MNFDIQKGSMWKRISAFLFDIILIGILAVGVAYLISLAVNYDSYSVKLEQIYDKYEQTYDINLDITEEEYNKLTPEQTEVYKQAYEALNADTEALGVYTVVVNLTILICSLSLLVAYIILEFILPIVFKNGQTLGKKIFGLAVMRADGVKISPLILFVRTILGKYTVETMIPVMILLMIFFNSLGLLGTIILALILLLQIIVITVTKNNSLIHDLLAQTVVVDMSSQRIFGSKDEMINYQKELAQIEAQNKQYK